MKKDDHKRPKDEEREEALPTEETTQAEQAPEVTPEAVSDEPAAPEAETVVSLDAVLKDKDDQYLRLLAEYDNFRKRSQKEREIAWSTAKAETAAAFLPVYDNLERALKLETQDEAFFKGVQMTMTQMKSILEKLGIEEIPALGEVFDPDLHNAVMHVEDEALGANVVAEVLQTGFRLNGKVMRFAMVKVAN